MNNDNENDKGNEKDSLFRDSMGMIKRYTHKKIEPDSSRPDATPKKSLADEQQVIKDMMSDDYATIEIDAGDKLFFANPGVQNKTLRKLRKGLFRIDAELDLHGMNVPEAKQQLGLFISECHELGSRCVRVIHGKGKRSGQAGPVLKQKLVVWLPQRDDVLAFCSTIPAHGGTGALYLLLKTKS